MGICNCITAASSHASTVTVNACLPLYYWAKATWSVSQKAVPSCPFCLERLVAAALKGKTSASQHTTSVKQCKSVKPLNLYMVFKWFDLSAYSLKWDLKNMPLYIKMSVILEKLIQHFQVVN